MNCSCPKKAAEALLDRILELLGADHIQRVILAPLDRAAASFAFGQNPHGAANPAGYFLAVTGDFVRCLYARGLRVPKTLDAVQAEAEAVFLLDRYYERDGGNGYEAALLDAAPPSPEGIIQTLHFLLGAVKQVEQRNHVRWVVQSLADPRDWTLKKELLLQLLRRGGDVFPPEVVRSPSRFTVCFPQLVMVYVEARAELGRLMGGAP